MKSIINFMLADLPDDEIVIDGMLMLSSEVMATSIPSSSGYSYVSQGGLLSENDQCICQRYR